MPPTVEEIMGVIQPVPCERMPERIAEEITVSTVPQTTEEIVDDLQLVPQFAGAPVPRIEEQVVDVFMSSPQVRVSERIGEWETKVQEQIVEVSQVLPQQRKKRVFVDLVPPHTAPKPCFSGEMPHRRANPCTGKVFTVDMPHQRVHWACSCDTVGLKLKGLDNVSQPGDVMVSITG